MMNFEKLMEAENISLENTKIEMLILEAKNMDTRDVGVVYLTSPSGKKTMAVREKGKYTYTDENGKISKYNEKEWKDFYKSLQDDGYKPETNKNKFKNWLPLLKTSGYALGGAVLFVVGMITYTDMIADEGHNVIGNYVKKLFSGASDLDVAKNAGDEWSVTNVEEVAKKAADRLEAAQNKIIASADEKKFIEMTKVHDEMSKTFYGRFVLKYGENLPILRNSTFSLDDAGKVVRSGR